MRQENLCKSHLISTNKKPLGTKFKCPICSRRMPVCSECVSGGDTIYFISQHNPKGFKKQKKQK